MVTLQHKIALSVIPGIGPRLIRRIVAYFGSVDAVFEGNRKLLAKVPGIGEAKAAWFDTTKAMLVAEQELKNIEKQRYHAYFYLDPEYPQRMRECDDAPVMLYVKGDNTFNHSHSLSIVGTRNATEYGKSCTEEIVSYLAERYPNMVIVSGLAYGIDIAAHKSALKNNIKTIAALGHGFNFTYPSVHRKYANQIVEQGSLVTEFSYNQKPDPSNFVSRNRIIASLSDAILVVESGEKGGALITADLGISYFRDVFAVPGKISEPYSKGCNLLIKSNKAALAECGADIELAMGWNSVSKNEKAVQQSLFISLSTEEANILNILKGKEELALDEISLMLNSPVAKVSAALLNLEFNGLVKPLPGKYFRKL